MDGSPKGSTCWYRRVVTAALVGSWLLLFTATHIPRVPVELEPNFSDKLQHYIAYAGLAVLAAACWTARRTMSIWPAVGIFVGLSIYGALDELTQPLFG